MDADLKRAIGDALDATVAGARPLSGGDINQAYAIRLADGRELFVKTNRRPPARMFPAEARGLAWLDEAKAIRVPRVIVAVDDFLILELVVAGQPVPSFDEDLGRALAGLHGAQPAGFGLDHDNYIGRLPQSNHPAARWSDFYRDERLAPQTRRAADAGLLSPRLRGGLDRVMSGIDNLVGPAEPPARLHGDLWGGNLMCDDRGHPCLIDPAAYGGDREVDLAMMRLFGGFGPRTFDAYNEAFPLAPGHDERVPLYQLYFLLVHVNLFGGSYLGSVESALSALV
jgi:fructosamine-3-kinase